MKKNLPLIVGIGLPTVFIIVISIVLYAPSMFMKPQHDFLYTTNAHQYSYSYGNYYRYQNDFNIIDNRLVLEPNVYPIETNSTVTYTYKEMPAIYRYDVKNNTSNQISFAEAQRLSLSAGPSSPDGYTVSYSYGYGDIFDLFGGGNESGYYLIKGRGKKTLPSLAVDQYWSRSDFELIGWVK